MLIIIAIISLFALLVILHEAGHFWAARRNGVEVEEFGFGFPPKLFGKQHKGTLYSVNLLPLGGFVRLKGEDSADTGPGTFGGSSLGTKTKILLAGVGMNLLTAFVIFYALCVTGIPGLGTMFEPSFLHSTYAQPKQIILAQVVKGSPAAGVGLVRGDTVLKLNETVLASDNDLREATKAHAGESVKLTVKHAGTEKVVIVTLRPAISTEGYLGVVSQQVYKLKYDPLSSIVAATYITLALTVATIVGVFQLIIHIPSLIIGLFSAGVPAAAESASGPVGIVFIMKALTSLGWSYVFLFMANISVALAAFNVLPLPALDGGRLAVILFGRVTKRHMSAETEARYHAIGFVTLIGLMVLISVYDLRKYF